jgi:hypothetical protein
MNPERESPQPQIDPWQELARACAPRQRIDRLHARAVLLAIGNRALEEDDVQAAKMVERTRELTAAREADWQAAVRDEILMASTEHVRSVDPRFLSRPDYDLHYAVEARADLEARLRAAEWLGIEVAPNLLERVAAADKLLEPLLRARPPQGGPRVG